MSCYSPIFFEPNWVMQRYFGWREIHRSKDLVVLHRAVRPFERYLFLWRSTDPADLTGAIGRWVSSRLTSEVYVHRFSPAPAVLPPIAGMPMRLVTNAESLNNNIGTFVIDLEQPLDALEANLHKEHRRLARKLEAGGARITLTVKPGDQIFDRFFAALSALHAERVLSMPDRGLLARMMADGHAELAAVGSEANGWTFAFVCLVGATAYYIYGVSTDGATYGQGQTLHWQLIRHYKELGLAWYDLGGIPSRDAKDGIYNFKRRFGGIEVDLGGQFVFSPWPVRIARRLRGTLRRMR